MSESLIPKTKSLGPDDAPRASELFGIDSPSKRRKAAAQSQKAAVVGFPLPENKSFLVRVDERFEEFLDYARTYRGHSPMSIIWYRRGYANLRRFLLEGAALDPDAFASRLTDIEEWVRWNRRRSLSPVTTNTYWRSVRVFFKDLEQRDGSQNPFHKMKAPPVPSYIPKALDAVQCRRILAAAESYPWLPPRAEYRRALSVAMVGVMLMAGLRRSEVIHLSYDDVRLDSKQLQIIRGKGKGGGKDRMAYVAPDLVPILYAYMRERRRLGIVIPEFFAFARTGRPMTLEGLHGILRKISKASGVKFSAHVLRHSFVSHLIRSGVSLAVVRDLAGHADIATTMGYVRVFDEDREEAMRKMRFK